MINARGWLVIAAWLVFGLILVFAGPSRAAEKASEPLGTYDCRDIRTAVALFPSIAAAEKAARAAGATQAQIEQARQCLSK